MLPHPIDGLLSFQQALNTGMTVIKLDANYVERHDQIDGGIRYSYAKVVDGEVQALATFRQEEPFKSVDRYSLNYSVGEKHRGRGLAVEAVNKGIDELKKEFSQFKIKRFYIETIIEVTNIHSIQVAKKLFPDHGIANPDSETGMSSLSFFMLIEIR